MPPTIRTAKKLMLGREVAHMIEQAGASPADVAGILGTSPSRMNLLLNGGGAFSPGDLLLLTQRLGVTDEGYLATLNELLRDNHRRGFWSTGYNRAYSEEIRLRIDMEQHADLIRSAYTEIVPGLLQCENYIRAMYSDPQSVLEGLTLEESVQARVARQTILDKPQPPVVHHVLSESCVRRRWAPAGVMREQVDHLIALSNRPNIMIQVLPFDVPPGCRSPIGTRFTLLRAPSPGVAGPIELAYLEGEGEIRYLDDKRTLAAYDTAWTRLTTAALSFAESRRFLREVRDHFDKLPVDG